MMTNMEVGKVDPLRLIPMVPEVCMRAGKSAKKVGRDQGYRVTRYDFTGCIRTNWTKLNSYLRQKTINGVQKRDLCMFFRS